MDGVRFRVGRCLENRRLYERIHGGIINFRQPYRICLHGGMNGWRIQLDVHILGKHPVRTRKKRRSGCCRGVTSSSGSAPAGERYQRF
ncbi:hypothetical protein DESC_360005 [Desulfosarcina cetonica]|nr:hypothetical protein DESC_360005 [Desulfosarcina cetonica]